MHRTCPRPRQFTPRSSPTESPPTVTHTKPAGSRTTYCRRRILSATYAAKTPVAVSRAVIPAACTEPVHGRGNSHHVHRRRSRLLQSHIPNLSAVARPIVGGESFRRRLWQGTVIAVGRIFSCSQRRPIAKILSKIDSTSFLSQRRKGAKREAIESSLFLAWDFLISVV